MFSVLNRRPPKIILKIHENKKKILFQPSSSQGLKLDGSTAVELGSDWPDSCWNLIGSWSTGCTIAFWVKPDSIPPNHGNNNAYISTLIHDNMEGFFMSYLNWNGGLQWKVNLFSAHDNGKYTLGLTGENAPIIDEWAHYVFVLLDGTDSFGSVYKNAVPIDNGNGRYEQSQTSATDIGEKSDNVLLVGGKFFNNPVNFANGTIDEIVIYDGIINDEMVISYYGHY